MPSQKYDIIAISDVHLHALDDERGKVLLDFVEGLNSKIVKHLVFGGDIFDFCYGGNEFYRKKFKALGCALSQIAKNGVDIVFIEGNHEYNMSAIGWEGVRFVEGRNVLVGLESGESVQFAHGDQIRPNLRYSFFRWLVRSWLVTCIASLVPGSLLDSFAIKNAEISRGADKYRKLDHDKILEKATLWLTRGEGDHGVFGHFHNPYAQKTKNKGFLIGQDSWDNPSFIAVSKDGVFSRVSLPDFSHSVILNEVKDP